MIKRYYSHYTFIYPDIYLKNVIIELDIENKIFDIFSFEKEIEKTEFYSGWLYFVSDPKDIMNMNFDANESHLFTSSELVLKRLIGKAYKICDHDKKLILDI